MPGPVEMATSGCSSPLRGCLSVVAALAKAGGKAHCDAAELIGCLFSMDASHS